MGMREELAAPGTGLRAQQLQLFGEYAGVFDRVRGRECEARVQAAGPHTGARLLKAIPPFMKWPIWLPQPERSGHPPLSSFGRLSNDAPRSTGSRSSAITTRSFNLLTVPRVIAEVSYLAGELGAHDRRVLCALSQHALESGCSETGYGVRVRYLCDILGISHRHRGNYATLPASLWRLARTVVHLDSRDELAGTWGTEGFLLLPRVGAKKYGREWMIEYDFSRAANQMIKDNVLCTVDVHRLHAMRSAAAENLYCLVYDVAQWSRLDSIAYSAPDLMQRLGITLHRTSAKGRTYDDWSTAMKQMRAASERVYALGQCLSDYQIEGRGAEAYVRYFLTSGSTRKTHLPPQH